MGRFIVIAIISFLAFSCGSKTDADKIGDAQICLDNIKTASDDANASDCIAEVDGITSTAADGIRCQGDFIREGLGNGARILSAMTAIDSGASGSNVDTMMGLLCFTSTGTLASDTSNALTAFNSCVSSDAKAASLLASFSYLTMSLMTFFEAKAVADGHAADCSSTVSTDASGYSYYKLSDCMTAAATDDPAIIVSLIDSSTNDADAETAQSGIGAVLIGAWEVACNGTGANANLCDALDSAVTTGGVSNPRAVAAAFFTSTLSL